MASILCFTYSLVYASEYSKSDFNHREIVKLESKKPDLLANLEVFQHSEEALINMNNNCFMPCRLILKPLQSIFLNNLGVRTTFMQDEIMRMNLGRGL